MGHHRTGPRPIRAARKYGLDGGRRPPPVESVVDQIYAAKPYATNQEGA